MLNALYTIPISYITLFVILCYICIHPHQPLKQTTIAENMQFSILYLPIVSKHLNEKEAALNT